MKIIYLLFWFLVFLQTLIPSLLFAFDVDTINSVERIVLKNGMQVWYKERPGTENLSIRLVVKVGSRYETQGNAGISHFIEHLLFDGNAKWKKTTEVHDAVNSLGGYTNGYTNKEHTIYLLDIPSKELVFALNWLKELIFSPNFDKDDIERERNVVIQEIGSNEEVEEGVKTLHTFEYLEKRLFRNDPIANRTIGWKDTLKMFGKKDLLEYYKKYYVPENMVLVIVGSFNSNELMNEISKTFDQVPVSSSPLKIELLAPKQANKFIEVKSRGYEKKIDFGFRTDGNNSKYRYALIVLNEIMNNKLYKEIRAKKGYSYNFGIRNVFYKDCGYIYAYANTDNIKEIERIFVNEFESLKKNKIDEKTLSDTKKYIQGSYMNSFNTNKSFSDMYADGAYRISIDEPVRNCIKEVDSVTVDDIFNVANQYFNEKNAFIIHRTNPIELSGNLQLLSINTEKIDVFLISRNLDALWKPILGANMKLIYDGIYRGRINYFLDGSSLKSEATQLTLVSGEMGFLLFEYTPFTNSNKIKSAFSTYVYNPYRDLNKLSSRFSIDMWTSLVIGEMTLNLKQEFEDYSQVREAKKNFSSIVSEIGLNYKISDKVLLRVFTNYYIDLSNEWYDKGINCSASDFNRNSYGLEVRFEYSEL